MRTSKFYDCHRKGAASGNTGLNWNQDGLWVLEGSFGSWFLGMCWWEFTGGVVNQKISWFQGGRMLRIDPVTEVLGRTQDRKWLLCFVAVKKPLESWSLGRQSKRPTIWTENTRGLSGMILLVKGWGGFSDLLLSFIPSGCWAQSCHLWPIPGSSGHCRRRRDSLPHPLGTETNHLWLPLSTT